MPKKTKQDKILAQLHRLQSNQTISESNVNPPKATVSLDLDNINVVAKQIPTTAIKVSNQDYSYVTKDLRKTLFFVVVAIIFEFFLSLLVKSWV